MRAQAIRFGAAMVEGNVVEVKVHERPFLVRTTEAAYLAESLIIATGASAKWLGLPSEQKLRGRGVSSCATCDGYFFRGQPVAIVGGGDSAMEEAIFLTKFASKVTVIHRRDELRASKIMQDKAFANPKIEFFWNGEVEDIRGDDRGEVSAVVVRHRITDELTDVPVSGVFVAIGHTPNTALFKGQLDMNPSGYLVTRDGTKTSVPGVFAAGDVQDHVYRQAVTAAGSGCMAALDAERFLAHGHSAEAVPAATDSLSR
jgi:thioredoxin reductase (NADPH)